MTTVRRDIYVALMTTDEPVPVGVLSFMERERADGSKVTGAARFSYLPHYSGPPLDPIHLNYKIDGRTFDLPESLKASGLFRVFADHLPGSWGRRVLAKEDPTTENMNQIQLLAHLAKAGRASGALFMYTRDQEDEHPLNNLKEVDGVRVKSLLELGGLNAAFTKNERDAAIIHGGARAKVIYQDVNGEVGRKSNHYIVKFNDRLDPCNFAIIEKSMMDLAKLAGMHVARPLIVAVKGESGKTIDHMYLSERYDRYTNEEGVDYRCHKISLFALSNASEVPRQDMGDYRDIFNAIRKCSSSPDEDCEMMYRRMVFNVATNNTDDHLLNHEMLVTQDRHGNTVTRLAPAFDLMPTAAPYKHATRIAGHENGVLSPEFISHTAKYFGIDPDKAESIRKEVIEALSKWDQVIRQNQGGEQEIEFVAKALSISGVRATNSMLLPAGMSNPIAALANQHQGPRNSLPPGLGQGNRFSITGVGGAQPMKPDALLKAGIAQVTIPDRPPSPTPPGLKPKPK